MLNAIITYYNDSQYMSEPSHTNFYFKWNTKYRQVSKNISVQMTRANKESCCFYKSGRLSRQKVIIKSTLNYFPT